MDETTGDRLRRSIVTLGAVLALTLSGCTMLEAEDDPTDDAEAFAQALSAGALRDVRFTDDSPRRPQRWWERLREGMAGSELTSMVVSVAEPEEERTTATLRHEWRLDAQGAPTWSYDTTVPMALRDDGWAVALRPGTVVAGLREGERLDLAVVAAERGDVLGAGGRPVVTERSVIRFGIDKTRVPAAQAVDSARALARLLDIDAEDLAERVGSAGDRAWVEALVLRQRDVTSAIADGLEDIPGAGGIADEIPLAPTRDFARPVLGTVGPVTAEMVEESEGAYAPGDVAGIGGLQQRYDERLRGLPGAEVAAVRASGEARELYRHDPQPGRPLRTTLDPDLQQLAERVLADVGPASALVALRPSDGAMLAVASGPGSDGYSTATLGQYAPGSTFKVVSALALLREGMSPDDPVSCPPSTVVDGKRFENYDDYPAGSLGRIPLREAVAQSCNTAFVSQHDRVGPDSLAAAAEALGLGQDYDVGFASYFGAVPGDGTQTERAASLIGQGKVLASPMAMAAVAGSVAAGRTVVPHLVADAEVEPSPSRPLTGEESSRLQALMEAVVEEGSGSGLLDLPGPPVRAKTGTAEFGDATPPETHAWMIATQGDLAVAVFVERGESGSRTAGPLLEAFLRGAGG